MAAKSKTPKNSIVWALDPFSDLKDRYAATARLLNQLAEFEKAKVDPTYVLSPEGLNWSGEFTGPWASKYTPLAQEAFRNLRSGLGLSGTDLTVIPGKESSLRADVKRLVDHAKKAKASLLVVQTHARRGMNRVLLGSFAETVLLTSKTPVLLMNPEAQVPSSIKKILFPTDLSSASKKSFKDIVKRCKAYGAELVIFHKLPDPIEPVVQTGVYMAGGGWITLYQYLEKESSKRRKACEELAAMAQKSGVSTSVVIEDQPGFVADSIRKHAERLQVDVIALASHAGKVSALLLGSVARDLARTSQHPVLVYHA